MLFYKKDIPHVCLTAEEIVQWPFLLKLLHLCTAEWKFIIVIIIKLITTHCRFLLPDNTQKILTEIWHHFWLKNDGEKWSRKKCFKIPRWPSELHSAKNLPRKAELAWQVSRYLLRPPLNFKIFFSKLLFTIILSPKWCQISVRIFCILLGTKNLQCYRFQWHYRLITYPNSHCL